MKGIAMNVQMKLAAVHRPTSFAEWVFYGFMSVVGVAMAAATVAILTLIVLILMGDNP